MSWTRFCYNHSHMEMPKEIVAGFCARPRDAHKRSVGTVTVVGGSHGFPHAPVIAGLGARAAGAGLVRLVVPTESRCAAGALLPEATVSDLGGEIPHSDVTVVGPGLGLGEAARLAVRGLLSGGGRLVVDADALTHLAAICGDGGGRDGGAELILTPHEGEAAKPTEVAPTEKTEAAEKTAEAPQEGSEKPKAEEPVSETKVIVIPSNRRSSRKRSKQVSSMLGMLYEYGEDDAKNIPKIEAQLMLNLDDATDSLIESTKK